MFEVLQEIIKKYDINEGELTSEKTSKVLADYVEHAEFDLIMEYLLATRQIQNAKLTDADNADKTSVEHILVEIEGLLRNVQDPALDSIKKEFLDEKGKAKAVAKVPYNVFRCAAMVIGAVFQISNDAKRKAALSYLTKVLSSLNRTFNAFSNASNFNKKVQTAVGAIVEWNSKAKNKMETMENQKTTLENERTTLSQKLEQVVTEKDALFNELQLYKSDGMSGKTTATMRTKNGKVEANTERDALVMRLYWKTSRITLLKLIMLQYQHTLSLEKNQHLNGSEHKLSYKLKKWAIELCAEEVKVYEVLIAIKSEENLRDLQQQIARANQPDMAGGPGLFNDVDKEDPLPGFTVSPDLTEVQAEVMLYKVERIAIMFGDSENKRLLPNDKKMSERFKECAIVGRRELDAIIMKRYWAPSRILMIKFVIDEYHAALAAERVSYQIGGVKLSSICKAWALELGLERKPRADILKEMKDALGERCTTSDEVNLEDADPVPGFERSSLEDENMMNKLKLLLEMFNDKSNARFLPFDQASSKFLAERVENLSQKKLSMNSSQ